MQAFTRYTAPAALLARENIDTDQIIPARFLTTTSREGLGRACFADWRDGARRAGGAGILVAGRNFGCGSSREHAPWALLDFGVRVVISTRIADIFRNNALKNGLLPIVVDEEAWARIATHAAAGAAITVDLASQAIELPDGTHLEFAIEAFARDCLLRGVDELGHLLGEADAIARFEARCAA